MFSYHSCFTETGIFTEWTVEAFPICYRQKVPEVYFAACQINAQLRFQLSYDVVSDYWLETLYTSSELAQGVIWDILSLMPLMVYAVPG